MDQKTQSMQKATAALRDKFEREKREKIKSVIAGLKVLQGIAKSGKLGEIRSRDVLVRKLEDYFSGRLAKLKALPPVLKVPVPITFIIRAFWQDKKVKKLADSLIRNNARDKSGKVIGDMQTAVSRMRETIQPSQEIQRQRRELMESVVGARVQAVASRVANKMADPFPTKYGFARHVGRMGIKKGLGIIPPKQVLEIIRKTGIYIA